MKELKISALVIYADKEHGSNFEYLTGFIPRFEEGLQILNQDGSSTLVLGNENYNKVKYARVKSEGVHCPLFSLPNQPMNDFRPLTDYLQQVDIDHSGKVGLVGWKLLANDFNDLHQSFDLPAFIVDRSEEHTSELQSRGHLVCRLLLEKKKAERAVRLTRGLMQLAGLSE